MDTLIQSYEISIRIGFFFSIFVVLAVWELFAPRRVLKVSKTMRWANNLGLVIINTLLLRALFPAAAIGMTAFSTELGWGVFNVYQMPLWFTIPASIAAMDFIIWLQHVMVHAVPVFWRLHRVHHADLDYDLTTGSRFHPIEIVLSMLVKFAAIVIIGPAVIAVIIFEVILNGMAMFNHANIVLPGKLDRLLKYVLVTPDMHRVHHSVEVDEANSNFGFCLSWWDRAFGTYKDFPRRTHEAMTIGIHHYRKEREVSLLPGMLMLPFRGRESKYEINKRNWEEGE